MPHEDGGEGDAPRGGAYITLLYVRPAREGMTELDARVGAIAERYARWIELVVVRPDEVAALPGMEAVSVAGSSSPALFLLRQGEVVGEAMGAFLPARELDHVVRCAVEWPAPL
jgi:hypothetical protein